MRLNRLATALLAWLALSGCAGSEAADSAALSLAETTGTTAPTTPTPTVNLGGEDGTADLSAFRCAADSGGTWTADGVITNSSPDAVDYQVTVMVSSPSDLRPEARQRILEQVRTDDPMSFQITKIPVSGSGDLTCQVRVVRLG